jgi:hypothetical protein
LPIGARLATRQALVKDALRSSLHGQPSDVTAGQRAVAVVAVTSPAEEEQLPA